MNKGNELLINEMKKDLKLITQKQYDFFVRCYGDDWEKEFGNDIEKLNNMYNLIQRTINKNNLGESNE